MGTVNGYTAERVKIIEDNYIVNGAIVNSHLILTRHDGTTIDAGIIIGTSPVSNSGITYVHAPTGVVSTDKVYLSDAIFDTPAGGKIVLLNGGDTPYATDVPWTINKDVSIEGEGVVTAVSFANGESPLVAPFLRGPVILQTAPAVDGIKITHSSAVVSLKNLGVRFNNPGTIAFKNTGHGITADAGPGKICLTNVTWEDVTVFGHDGNHYAFNLVGALLCRFQGLRSYGGGHILVAGQSGTTCGNLVFIDNFGSIFCAGTAHGIGISGTDLPDGSVGLLSWYRPQVNENNYSFSAAYGNPAPPTPEQYLWTDFVGTGIPSLQNIYDGDMEPQGVMTYPNIGRTTYSWGHGIFSTIFKSSAYGENATAGEQGTSLGNLAKADGIQSVALGNGAHATNHLGIAIGNGALAWGVGGIAIGCDNSWTSAVSVSDNEYMHGTALHKHFMPGVYTRTVDPHIAGMLWNKNGVPTFSIG